MLDLEAHIDWPSLELTAWQLEELVVERDALGPLFTLAGYLWGQADGLMVVHQLDEIDLGTLYKHALRWQVNGYRRVAHDLFIANNANCADPVEDIPFEDYLRHGHDMEEYSERLAALDQERLVHDVGAEADLLIGVFERLLAGSALAIRIRESLHLDHTGVAYLQDQFAGYLRGCEELRTKSRALGMAQKGNAANYEAEIATFELRAKAIDLGLRGYAQGVAAYQTLLGITAQ